MAAAPRIITLIPSATEIVAALGLARHIVGRSHECDFPAEVVALPPLTRPRFSTDQSSAKIHESVSALLDQALGIYALDIETFARLAPTHIVTQTRCEVCSVSLAQVEEAAASLLGTRPTILALAPMRLEDVFEDTRRVAEALGVTAQAERCIGEWRARLARLDQMVQPAGARPRIACIEWCAPLMSVGNWVPELVERAGGRDVLGRAGEHAPVIATEALLEADPDIVVFMPCGYDLERTEADARKLLAEPRWRALSAFRAGRLYASDGNAYFNRPGPRLVDSAEILAEIIAPERCRFGHEGRGWRRLSLS